MLLEYKFVYQGGEAEIVEKKSRFIANVRPVKNEEEALGFLEEIRKKHWGASHHCYAYVAGENRELQRCSDDGEPGGTAGRPMLDVLLGEELRDTAVVVTRYFGGTLLGTGGLVRAYQGAAKAGIEASTVITKKRGRKLTIKTDYTGLGKIQYILGQRKIKTMDTQYTDSVTLAILVSAEEEDAVRAELIEGTNGQAAIEEGEVCWFAEVYGEMKVFDA